MVRTQHCRLNHTWLIDCFLIGYMERYLGSLNEEAVNSYAEIAKKVCSQKSIQGNFFIGCNSSPFFIYFLT